MQQRRAGPWKLASIAIFIIGLGVINVFSNLAGFVLGILLMASGIVLLVGKGFR